MISHVILYNATDAPYKVVGFAQYKEAHARDDYAQLAVLLGFANTGIHQEEQVVSLVRNIEALKANIGIPACIKDALRDRVTFEEYEKALDELAENAFDDQCTGTNPRAPLIADLRKMMFEAWEPVTEETYTLYLENNN